MKKQIPLYVFILLSSLMSIIGTNLYFQNSVSEDMASLLMLPFFYLSIVLLTLGLIGVKDFKPLSRELIITVLGLYFAILVLIIDFLYLRQNPEKLQDFLSNILVEANGMMLDIIFIAFLYWTFKNLFPTKNDQNDQ